MPDKFQLLHRYWGYDTFRPLQEEVIDSVVQGLDVLVLLPTGGGKSLCYQLPALMREGLCLVVSPLIALMKDQVQHLGDKGLKAACLVSGMRGEESTKVLYNAIAGELKFLYVSPERLRNRRFIEHLRQMKVGLIAVDEAHCISQWGYDFRPPYLQIAEIRAYHPHTPLIALTATATPAVVDDICQRLQMHNCRRFKGSFYRSNLSYQVWRGDDMTTRLLDLLQREEGTAIVYARNRRLTQSVADLLNANNVSAACYHAGLDMNERDRRQSLWMEGKCRVMVATNAFGMGIDKPDVRLVVHLDIPDSLEAYYQEAGRAGRDGRPARAVLLCSRADDARLERDLDIDFPQVGYIRNIYKALCNFYKIPMGSGADSCYDFDLVEICNAYNLDVRRFYSACRFLEKEGLISLPDRGEAFSQLFIPLKRDELYRFQVDHLVMGNLLLAIIRLYPGLFTGATFIDEGRVARQCLMEPCEVVSLLVQMNDMHVVEYHPRPTKPQILFPSARINEKDLFLNDECYSQLRSSAHQRKEAILQYVHDDRQCRSRQLLAYFGEDDSSNCGICDVCRKKKTSNLPPVEEKVAEMLDQGALSVKELCGNLENMGYPDASGVVKALLDKGVVYLDKNLFVNSR